jgi:hypothetical protein
MLIDATTFCRRAPLSRPALREAEDERGEAGWDGEDGAMRLRWVEAGMEKPLRSPAPARARAVGEAGGRASAGGLAGTERGVEGPILERGASKLSFSGRAMEANSNYRRCLDGSNCKVPK